MALNPFLAALSEGGEWRGFLPALLNMGRIKREQEAGDLFASEVTKLISGTAMDPMANPVANATPITSGPVGSSTPAVAGGMPATVQPAQPPMDPARAMMEVMARNPKLLYDLPQQAFANATDLVKLFQAGTPNPTPQMQNYAAMQGALPPGTQLSPDQLASGFGFGGSDKLAVARSLASGEIPGVPALTPEQWLTYFDAIEKGQTINVAAPDLGPVFEFMQKEQVAGRQEEISAIDKALYSLDEAINLTNSPEASFFFGPAAWLGERAAGLTTPLNEILGMEKNRPLVFAGPDAQTLGGARSVLRQTMLSTAQAVLSGDVNKLSNEERRKTEMMAANPDAFLSSPDVARGAFMSLQSYLMLTRRRTAQELQQGGVQAEAPAANPQGFTSAEKQQIKTRAEALKAADNTLTWAQAYDKAEQAVIASRSAAGGPK